ncbi:hypothetical protein TNCV_2455351 [Trichonephila clavipes]|nr:hypothetical protein TNCV_2455351 [Trichonephila clavipes]
MSRSGDQSDAKPPMFSPQTSFVLIYRPTERVKGCVNLAQPENRVPNLWYGSAMRYHSATGLRIRGVERLSLFTSDFSIYLE